MTAWARAYFLAHRVAARLGGRAQAVHDGLWLGALDRDRLYELDRHYYDAGPAYHGDEHNARGLFPWEEAALADAFAGRRRLRVLGAGGGREVLALARRGHEVEGFECNASLVAYAQDFLRRHAADATVAYLARDEAPPAPAEPVDGVIVGWSAYMLIPGRARRVTLLRALRAQVAEGAPLLLSFFTRAGDGPRFRTTARVANALRARLGREPVETGDLLHPNFVHAFTRDEIATEMAEGGFALRRFEPQGPGRYDSGWATGLAR